MRDETPEQPAPLRTGLTTGSCATATSLAAARLLLADQVSEHADITLPKGRSRCRSYSAVSPETIARKRVP